MSNHSRALPSEVAITSLVTFLPRDGATSGASACASAIFDVPFPVFALFLHLAQIPEQSRHDAERLFSDRQQNVLVGRVLRTAGIGVRHPDRRQAKPFRKHV